MCELRRIKNARCNDEKKNTVIFSFKNALILGEMCPSLIPHNTKLVLSTGGTFTLSLICFQSTNKAEIFNFWPEVFLIQNFTTSGIAWYSILPMSTLTSKDIRQELLTTSYMHNIGTWMRDSETWKACANTHY